MLVGDCFMRLCYLFCQVIQCFINVKVSTLKFLNDEKIFKLKLDL